MTVTETQLVPLAGAPYRRVVDAPPGVFAQYLRALLRAPFRRQGRLVGPSPGRFVIEQERVSLDPVRLEVFRRACHHPDGVPLTFPETLFHGLMAEAVLSPGFPLAPLGLVHVGQQARLHEALSGEARYHLACRLSELRLKPRGCEVDFAMEARREGALAWEGLATLISRGRRPPRGDRPPPAETEPGGWSSPVSLGVPAEVGRQYAAASGDWNPHHVSRLGARLFGFPRPIAHGMWTLSRVLAWLETAGLAGPPVAVDARFRKPVLLPGSLSVRYRQEPDGALRFEARDPASGGMHLEGTVR